MKLLIRVDKNTLKECESLDCDECGKPLMILSFPDGGFFFYCQFCYENKKL